MCEKLSFKEIISKKDDECITEDELIKVLKVCYKKLKSYVYHDNTNLFIREQICKYESESINEYELVYKSRDDDADFDILNPKLEKLAERILNGDLQKYIEEKEEKEEKEDIKVNYYCLPKSVEGQEKNSKNDISNFTTSKEYELSKVTYFINIDVDYHILGVLWIMLFGRDLEKKYNKYNYGNKLERKFDEDNINLFVPYFKQYQNWRDRGINSVEQMMKEEKRCLMITLDIKDYFYTANIDFDKLKKELSLDNYKKANEKNYITKANLKFMVNKIIIDIFKKYTEKIKNIENSKNTKNTKVEHIIPIGFTPSYIISNWYLNNFDNQVVKHLNPIYFGRYVDDVTIVIPINIQDDKNESYKEVLHERFYKKGILEYAIQRRRNKGNQDDLIKLDNKNSFENIKNIFNNIPREEFKLKSKLIEYLKNTVDEIKKVLGDINSTIIEGERKEYDLFNKALYNIKNYVCEENLTKYKELVYVDWKSNDEIKSILESLRIIYEYERVSDIVDDLTKKIFIELEFESDEVKKVYLISDYYKQNIRSTKTHLANLCIQEAKVKVYDFKSDGSNALLNKFKQNLFKTASAFNLLPEKSNIIEEFDDEVYDIYYSGSINKLSSIDDFKINKYGISKFLAQVIYSDKLENNQNTDEVEDKILHVFKNNTCIELYGLWEKVMMYYMVNNQHDHLMKFIKEIIKSIDNLKCNIDKYQRYHPKNKDDETLNNDILNTTKESLIKHLGICLSMVYSLNDELFLNEIEEKDCDNYKDKKILNSICKALKGKGDLDNKEMHDYINKILNSIYTTKEHIRKSNMIRHAMVRETLMNYTICVTKKISKKNINLIEDKYSDLDIRSDLRCSKLNKNYKYRYNCDSPNNHEECIFNINYAYAKYSPRFVHLHELILYNISLMVSKGKIVTAKEYMKKSIEDFKRINNLLGKEYDYNEIYYNIDENRDSESNRLDNNRYKFSENDYLITQKESNINIIDIKNKNKLDKLKLGVVNMKVSEDDIDLSFSKTPNLHSSRVQKISHLLNEAVKNKANMIIFPEVSIPYQLINSICKFAMKHNIAIICGLEHIVYENGLCCNYLATILPGQCNEYRHAVVKLRLKNHYSPREKEYVKGFNWNLPIMINNHDKDFQLNKEDKKAECEKCKESKKTECEKCKEDKKETFIKEYDLIKWAGVDFSTYSCFELADIKDRSLFTSHVDLLIGSVHNKDVNYYSNIIESLSRDVHCYFVQVNNSEIGDNRVISPSKSVNKNILQITGGENDLVLISEIDIKSLREFQKKAHNLQVQDDRFKPVPPGFDYNNVKLRDEMPL